MQIAKDGDKFKAEKVYANQVLVNGTPVFPIALAVGVMLAWLLGSLAVAIRFFRWQ